MRGLHGLVLEPVEEAGECYGIFAHRQALALELGSILHALHLQHRARADVHLVCSRVDSLVEGLVDLATIVHDTLGRNMLQVVEDRIVIGDANAYAMEVSACCVVEFVRRYEEGATVHLHYHITDEAWGIVHIFAADIEYPSYLVEGRDDQGIAVALLQGLAHACEFALNALAGVLLLIRV